MQAAITWDMMVAGGAALIIIAVLFIFYYKHFILDAAKTREIIEATHFQELSFIADTPYTNIGLYNKAWGKRLTIPLVIMIGCFLLPAFFHVPPPYDMVALGFGALIGLASLLIFITNQKQEETARNLNKPFGSAHTFYPTQGDISQLLKRMEVEKELKFSDTEYEQVAGQAVEGMKSLKGFTTCGLTEEQLKKNFLDRIKGNHTYRMRVADKYRVLLVTKYTFEEMKTLKPRLVFDETIDVNVNDAPMFLFYVGPGRAIFKTKDNKGRTEFADRTTGVFVDLFDLAMRNELLLKGNFTALTKTDALLAQLVDVYEKNLSTATEMTKNLRDLEKSRSEILADSFDAKSIANNFISAETKMMKLLASLASDTETKNIDYLPWVLLIAAMVVLFFHTLFGG